MKRYYTITGCINFNSKRLFFIFFIFLFFSVKLIAINSFHFQGDSITLQFKNTPLEKVLDAIEEQSHYYFLYNEKLVDVRRIVSVNVQRASLYEVLDQLFLGTNVSYMIKDNKIILVPEEISFLDQNYMVSGRVVDEMGYPLPGVNIFQEGAGNGTISDLDGNYSLYLSSGNATLVFSFLGYLTEKVSTVGKTTINIVLKENILDLDEVIITALGILREEKALGYSVQKIKGGGLNTVKGVNVTTSLTGKVSGLLILNNTEFAGTDSIHIRGETPLLVIDGVPYHNMSLRDIPQDNIEEISILKGATASSLYGYRGQSGAILIVTKKSIDQKGFNVSVNSSTMFSSGFLVVKERY